MAKSTSAIGLKIKSVKNRIKAVNDKIDAFEDRLVDKAKYRWQMVQLYKMERELAKEYEVINKPLREELKQLTTDHDTLSQKINKSPKVDINGRKVSPQDVYNYMFPKNGLKDMTIVNDEVLEIFQQEFSKEYAEILRLRQHSERKAKLEYHLSVAMGGNLPETEELDKKTLILLKKLHKTARVKESKVQAITQGLKQDFMAALSKNPSMGIKIADYKPEMKFNEFWGEMTDSTYDKATDFLMEASRDFSDNISKRYPQLKGCLKDIEDCLTYDHPRAIAEYREGYVSYYSGTLENAPEVIPHELDHFLQDHGISALPKRALKIFEKYGPLNNQIPHEDRAFEKESILIGETIAKNFKHEFGEFLKHQSGGKTLSGVSKSRD